MIAVAVADPLNTYVHQPPPPSLKKREIKNRKKSKVCPVTLPEIADTMASRLYQSLKQGGVAVGNASWPASQIQPMCDKWQLLWIASLKTPNSLEFLDLLQR